MLEAPLQAQKVAVKYALPDLWVTSPAVRAYQTARIFARVWGNALSESFDLEPRIYEAAGEVVAEVAMEALDRCATSAVVFGHNPGLSQAVYELCRENCDFKTSGVAVLQTAKEGRALRLVEFMPGGRDV